MTRVVLFCTKATIPYISLSLCRVAATSCPSSSYQVLSDHQYRKCFTIPEVLCDPSLLLSPHIFLLSILLRHRAFRSERINQNPYLISQIRIRKGENEVRLHLLPEVQEMYVFRGALRTAIGFRIGDEPITVSTMCKWVSAIGRLAGFEH